MSENDTCEIRELPRKFPDNCPESADFPDLACVIFRHRVTGNQGLSSNYTGTSTEVPRFHMCHFPTLRYGNFEASRQFRSKLAPKIDAIEHPKNTGTSTEAGTQN